MIKGTVNLPIKEIRPAVTINSFTKRELILVDIYERGGERFENPFLVEFTGERMNLLDNFAPGQYVTVEYCINGKEKEGRYFNTIRGLNINPYMTQPQPQGYVNPSNGAQYPTMAQPQTFQPQSPYGGQQFDPFKR